MGLSLDPSDFFPAAVEVAVVAEVADVFPGTVEVSLGNSQLQSATMSYIYTLKISL